MTGRYGNDTLNYALFVFYAILALINMFAHNLALSLIMLAVLVVIVVRAFSRNIYTRIRENERFLKVWKPTKAQIILLYDRFRERKTNVYRKCPECKAVIRLPRKSGNHTVRCPKCSKTFKVNIK